MSKQLLGCLYGACMIALAAPAAAQQAGAKPAAEVSDELGEIVVTALRRAENIQDVPASISAVSGSALLQRGLQQVGDLSGLVPNLQVSTVGGDGTPIFSLRGISMNDYGFNQQGPVATYYDEVYRGSLPLIPLGMFDLERIEVLRGPQGTLYGKNTTGGAVNFISRKPGFDTEGYLKLGYGNYNRFDADGAAQTALSDTVAARVAFTASRADGWMKNLLPGKPDPAAVRQYGVRASVLFKPGDQFDAVLRLSTSRQNPYNTANYVVPGPAGIGAGIYELVGGSSYFRTGLNWRQIESNDVQRRRQRTYAASLNANWHLSDDLTVTSVTSYDYGRLFFPEDFDGSPLAAGADALNGRARQFSQDLRLASDYDGGLNFIVGAYYAIEKIHTGAFLTYYGDLDLTGDGLVSADDCLLTFFLGCTVQNDYRQTKKTAAVYGDVNFKVSDRVTLRGGLRYTHDTGRVSDFKAQLLGADGTPIANTIPGDPVDFDATTTARFRKGTVTGKVGIDFNLADDVLLYVSASRGYRANAFNSQAYLSPVELNVAKPETVYAYEAGFKSQFMDRAVTLNGAVFYYDYKNQQALNVDPVTFAATELNIDKSRILGGELELTVRASSALRINAGLGLLDTKMRRGTLSGVSLAGNQLTNAPKMSLSGGFDWDVVRTDSGRLTLSANGNYVSKQYFDVFNTDRIAQKSYGLVNSQLGWRFNDDRFGVGIWGKNLFNKYYARYSIDLSAIGGDYFRPGDPRTYGVTIDAKF